MLPVGTVKDDKGFVNVIPFGVCLRQYPPVPCTPKGSWKNPSANVKIDGAKVLTKDSTYKCDIGGGSVSVMSSGQSTVNNN